MITMFYVEPEIAKLMWMIYPAILKLLTNQGSIFFQNDQSFGNKGEKRSFKASWFDTWPWFGYQDVSDSIILFYYCHASNRNLLMKGLHRRCKEAFMP